MTVVRTGPSPAVRGTDSKNSVVVSPAPSSGTVRRATRSGPGASAVTTRFRIASVVGFATATSVVVGTPAMASTARTSICGGARSVTSRSGRRTETFSPSASVPSATTATSFGPGR
ncbi:hypothetical protein BRD17_05420 [Halobacteriales archaeon SW_7_68_16]|nr:MAG: hypothetical protein BRD17_05420 [Halobacteriales archaeon SW_7_68_16]